MYNVRLTPYRSQLGTIFDRQTRNHSLVSLDGRYRFWIGDHDQMPDPDFWVVQGKGVRQGETYRVAPQNTILLTTEPRSVLYYPQRYIDQFGMVCTCQEQTRHPNVHYGPAILPWFIGYTENPDDSIAECTLDYDRLKAMPTPPKPKLLSVITSNKAFTQGHIDRIRFVEKLKAHYGDQLDIYGRGFNDFGDKWDVLSQYQYHIVIENSSQKYYWTEKLSDCLLAETFPFYYGCTNLTDYVAREAFEPIDIKRPDEAIRIIDSQIKAQRYQHSKGALAEAKHLMLDRYNMFEYIVSLCDQLDASLPKQEVTIMPCRSSQDFRNLWRYSVTRKWYELKYRLTR